MSAWEKLLEQPHSCGHFVQLYEDELALARNVGRFFWEGLRRGGGVLAIATPAHRELFERELDRLGGDISALENRGQLVFRNARETLARVTLNGRPNWRRFEETVNAETRAVVQATDSEDLRAYGEMVGILWEARQYTAANRLEQLWNKLLENASFSLYCSYAIDVFGGEFRPGNLEAVLRAHTHLLPAETGGALEQAIERAMDEICGAGAADLRTRIKACGRPGWAVIPNAEWTIYWLRENLPEQANRIIAQARDYFQACAGAGARAGTLPAVL